MPTPITQHDFPEIRWHANWIWVPEEPVVPSGGWAGAIDPHAQESHGLFRRTFALEQVPERVPARITADSRYVLYVNGREVGRGPIRSQFRKLHYDLYDLAPYLRPGENTVAVYVKYYGQEKAFWMPATPNRTLGKTGVLVCEADLGEAAGGWLVTDDSWKARKAHAWDHPTVETDDIIAHSIPGEVFDARQLDSTWREPAFNDGEWGQAQVVHAMYTGTYRSQPPTHPYGPLYPRPIAQLGGEVRTPASVSVETLDRPVDTTTPDPVRRVELSMEAHPVSSPQPASLPLPLDIPAGGYARLTVDMGRIVSGFVRFGVEAPAGTTVDISYMEEPYRPISGFGRMRAGTRYTARGRDDLFEQFDAVGFRYAYLLVHGANGPVTLRSFGVREHLYPWQERATFTSSDPDLNSIFEAGMRTVELCSSDALIDCPTREQRAWVGDGVVHQMVHLATNADWRLARRYLTLGNSPRNDGILPMFVVSMLELQGSYTLPDWSLHWIHGLHNIYRYSGDRDLVTALVPTAAGILRWYASYQTEAGVLKDVAEWNLVDWSSVSVSDTSSILTALWARGLREFAEIAGWLGENASRAWAEGLYERARAGFDVFWDQVRGSYFDHIVDGEPRPEMNQIAGAIAIASGLAPRERWERIVETITDPTKRVVRSWTGGGQSQRKMEQEMYGIYEIDWDAEREIVSAEPFMSYVVHDAVALAGRADILPDIYPRWLEFLQDGYDTLGENWGAGTHAHGWSSTPTRDMLVYTLGVTPAEPGYTSARITPRLGRLTSAQGTVPTPHGPITVDATHERVIVDSPVPVVLDIEGQQPRTLEVGRHEIPLTASPLRG